MKRTLVFLLIGLLVSALTATANSLMTWGGAQDISGDTDVSTAGTLVGAFNIGGAGVGSTTVNGVTFNGLAVSGASVTSGNFTFAIATSFGSLNSVGSASPPFSGLSAPYQALLSSAAGDFTTPFTLTINGLVTGRTYQFEWWSEFSHGFGDTLTTATAGNAVTLHADTGLANGGLGQFAIGTFVADGTGSETVTFSSTFESVMNGVQVRDLSAGNVPDAGSTMALFGLALVGVAGFRRTAVRG